MRKNKILFYLNHMHSRGFTPEHVLQGTGLTKATVLEDSFTATPDYYRRIIHNMQALTEDPLLGFTLGSAFKISDLGILGYAALSAATLEQARKIIVKYFSYNDYMLMPCNYLQNRTWYTELRETFPLGDLMPFAVEEFSVRTMTIPMMLTGKPYPILEFHAAYPKPDYADRYKEILGCPCYFNQPRNLLKLDTKRLSNKVLLAEESVFKLCKQQCEELIRERSGSKQLADKVKRTLLQMPGQFPTMDDIAAKLNMSTRTLRRQLATENITYQQIIDSTRKALATQYLQHTNLSAKEISYALGYNHVSNFRKAFKGWLGVNISEYKKGIRKNEFFPENVHSQ